MKFVLSNGFKPFKAYGFDFSSEPVEVNSESLIAKFKKYESLTVEAKEVKSSPKKKASPKKKIK